MSHSQLELWKQRWWWRQWKRMEPPFVLRVYAAGCGCSGVCSMPLPTPYHAPAAIQRRIYFLFVLPFSFLQTTTTTTQSIAYPRRVVPATLHRDIYLFSFLQAEFSVERRRRRERGRSSRCFLCFIWCHVCSFQLQPGRPNGSSSSPDRPVSSSVVVLLSFCFAQRARLQLQLRLRLCFIFFPPIRVWQQPQNHFTSLSFNKLYNIFNLKRNKINLLDHCRAILS